MRARSEVGQFRRVDLLQARAIDHHDRGQLRDSPGLPPERQVRQAVGADQEEQVVIRLVAADGLERFDAVVRAGPHGLDLRDRERRVPGDRDPGHLQPVSHRGPITGLVRRCAGDHEPEPVQPACLTALLGQNQMSRDESGQTCRRKVPVASTTQPSSRLQNRQ